MSNFDYNYHESFISKNISHLKNEISKVKDRESEMSKQHLFDCSVALNNFECLLIKLKDSKVLEEKLRWIPIAEKLPPLNEYVLFKYSEGEYCVGCLNVYGYYCSPYIPAEEDFASIHLLSEVTHWRYFL
jgi:hypothetical protein